MCDVAADAAAVVFEPGAVAGALGSLASILAIRSFAELISPESFWICA